MEQETGQAVEDPGEQETGQAGTSAVAAGRAGVASAWQPLQALGRAWPLHSASGAVEQGEPGQCTVLGEQCTVLGGTV